MNTPLKMLLFVLCLDAFFLLANLSIAGINPSAPTFASSDNPNGHLITQFGSNYTLETWNTTANRIPQAQQGITEDTGTIFADIWNTIKGWIFDATGLAYVIQVIGAPYYFLKGVFNNAEYQSIVYIIGALWYAFSLFAIISWALGRD
jgi:hypothetical protein